MDPRFRGDDGKNAGMIEREVSEGDGGGEQG